jgi:hypothetical protein
MKTREDRKIIHSDEGIIFHIATVSRDGNANVFAECYTLQDLYDAIKAWFDYMESFGCYDSLKGLFISFDRVRGRDGEGSG